MVVAAAVLLLPGLLQWVIYGRADYAIVGAAGLVGVGVALLRWQRRERDRS